MANGDSGMGESKHTQGPWRGMSSDYFLIHGDIDQRNLLVATLCPIDYGDEDIANVNLVAAAPDLLAALEGLMNPKGFLPDYEEYEAAEAAIAKAKGETNA